MDLGTGDGRFVLATAEAQPDTLAIGVDADAGSMAEASRRAARTTKRGALPRALFVVAAAEALPTELDGRADVLTVQFPWGSLLRGLLAADPAIVGGMARVARPGATVTLLLSVTERDRATIGRDSVDAGTFRALAPRYAAHGLQLCEARPATAEEIARSRSTWAKKLRAGDRRPAWLVRFERVAIVRCRPVSDCVATSTVARSAPRLANRRQFGRNRAEAESSLRPTGEAGIRELHSL